MGHKVVAHLFLLGLCVLALFCKLMCGDIVAVFGGCRDLQRSLGGEAATTLDRKFARKYVMKLVQETFVEIFVVVVRGVVGVGVGVSCCAMAARI